MLLILDIRMQENALIKLFDLLRTNFDRFDEQLLLIGYKLSCAIKISFNAKVFVEML